MDHSTHSLRAELLERAINASSLYEIADVRESLDEWLLLHPEDQGMHDVERQLGITERKWREQTSDGVVYMTRRNS